jgi:hypothetical protein
MPPVCPAPADVKQKYLPGPSGLHPLQALPCRVDMLGPRGDLLLQHMLCCIIELVYVLF